MHEVVVVEIRLSPEVVFVISTKMQPGSKRIVVVEIGSRRDVHKQPKIEPEN